MAELEADKRRLTYEVYVTDMLVAISRAQVNVRYADLVSDAPKETRTEEQIIESIRAKIGGGDNAST